MSDFVQINSGQTLSVFKKPGEDIRFPATNSESLFTFGSFKMQKNTNSESLSADSRNISFGTFSTLDSLSIDDVFNPTTSFSVDNRELKFKKTDPLSYAYFSSFYTSVAQSINDINDNFPYALVANKGITILDYQTTNLGIKYETTFKIPYTSVTNQGDVLVNSGYSEKPTLFNNTDQFSIQLAGETQLFDIIEYSFIPYSPTQGSSYLSFKIDGYLFDPETTVATTFNNHIYIRPNKKRLNNYYHNLTRLQKQILLEGEFLIPSTEEPDVDKLKKFIWPKEIDGFNPDNQGEDFDAFLDEILYSCQLVDDNKTSIMLRTMVPENFLEQDSDFNDYRSLIEIYAKEFDDIKQFIDTISFAHTIDYNEEESVPNKFLFKLSGLLGWELSESFNETNLFEYLIGDIENDKKTLSHANIELWKRILINIIWLFKKKGTRDALQFIFKLVGAPECLINFNEFVYDIKKVSETKIESSEKSPKINENGYINYDASKYIFQEGGIGRGNGQDYINQWKPEFDPIIRVDNLKIQIGAEEYYGTENIVNTKELDISISPANAIECDLFNWFKNNDVCWVWGTTGATFAFSALTIPFQYLPANCGVIEMSTISEMTFSQFSEHIFANTVNPVDRKTVDQSHTSFWYEELKKIYLLYYYTTSSVSHRITFRKLENYIDLLSLKFAGYFEQLIPATTIYQGSGIEYRNTIFNRQKFVYKEGINKGSEFKSKYIPPVNSTLKPILPSVKLGDIKTDIKIIEVKGSLTTNAKMQLNPVNLTVSSSQIVKAKMQTISIKSTVKQNVNSFL